MEEGSIYTKQESVLLESIEKHIDMFKDEIRLKHLTDTLKMASDKIIDLKEENAILKIELNK